jgi:hypothetical protein
MGSRLTGLDHGFGFRVHTRNSRSLTSHCSAFDNWSSISLPIIL